MYYWIAFIVAVIENIDDEVYTLAAEVGLLTRNVKIIGESYAKQEQELFGARVIVGKMADGDKEAIGNHDLILVC